MKRFLCLLLFSSIVAAADHPAWTTLGDDVLAALRIHGGGPAVATLARSHLVQLFADPRRQAALAAVWKRMNEKSPETKALGEAIAAKGFAPADVWSVLAAGEVGVAVGMVGEGQASKPAIMGWMTIGDELWGRIDRLLGDQHREGVLERQDLERDGQMVIACRWPHAAKEDAPDRSPPTLCLARDAQGRCWLRIGEDGAEPGAVANALVAWVRRAPDAARLSQRAGAAGVMAGSGERLCEFCCDIPAMRRLIDSVAPPQQMALIHQMTGLDSCGLAGFILAMDGNRLVQEGHLAMSGPRSGIMSLLDAPMTPPTVPAWIPVDAISVGNATLDLEVLYSGIRAALVAAQGEKQAETIFQTFETQASAFLGGLTPPQLLAAFGRNWWQIDLPDSTAELVAGHDRAAVVIEVRDQKTVSRLLPLASMAGQGKGVKFVTEQGCQGVRMVSNPQLGTQDMAAFIGPRHLVIGIGAGVAEELLASIARSDGRFATSTLASRAMPLLPPEPSLYWTITDSSTIFAQLPQVIKGVLGNLQKLAADEEDRSLVDEVLAVLPSSDEMGACFVGGEARSVMPSSTGVRLLSIVPLAMGGGESATP